MATVQVNQTWTSGAFSTTNNYVKFKVRIKEISYDTIANTSEVTVSVYAYRTNSGYTTYGSGTIDVEIEGTNYHASISPTITDSNTTLFSRTLTVAHETDGTLILNTSTEWRINAPGSGSYNYTGTTSAKDFNKALSTIPRGSTITAPDSADMGSAISITVTQADASFSHRLYYRTPNGNDVLIGSHAGDNTYSWTVYDDAAAMSGTDAKEYYTLLCRTYFSNDYSGEYVDTPAQLLAYVGPSSYPTITIDNVAEAGNVPPGFPFLVGLSIPQITTTATAKDNATLVSRKYTLSNGEQKTVTTSAQTDTVTMTKVLSGPTTDLAVQVTDSRGTSGSATQSITAFPYTAPSIELRVTRADSGGNPDAVGTYCKVEAKWTWQSIMNPSELNGATIAISVNGTPTASYTTATNTQTAFTQIALLSGINITDQYVISAVITDTVGQTAPDSKTITKSQMPLSLYDDGSNIGVTLGRMATQGDLNIWLNTRLISGNSLILNDGNGNDTDSITTDDLFNVVGNAPSLNGVALGNNTTSGDVGIGTLAWTNPDGDSTGFATKTVTLTGYKESDYLYYEVIFNGLYNSAVYVSTGKLPVGKPSSLFYLAVSSSNYRIRAREVTASTDSSGNIKLTFAQGYQWTGGSTTGSSNNICIPVLILLYK